MAGLHEHAHDSCQLGSPRPATRRGATGTRPSRGTRDYRRTDLVDRHDVRVSESLSRASRSMRRCHRSTDRPEQLERDLAIEPIECRVDHAEATAPDELKPIRIGAVSRRTAGPARDDPPAFDKDTRRWYTAGRPATVTCWRPGPQVAKPTRVLSALRRAVTRLRARCRRAARPVQRTFLAPRDRAAASIGNLHGAEPGVLVR
jgi:hypothetical protein